MSKHRILFEFAGALGSAQTAGTQAGWTEAWYDSADTTDEAAVLKALALRDRRKALLTQGWAIVALRVSQLDASNNLLRKGSLIQIQNTDGRGTYPNEAGPNDEQPWDAINISMQTVGGSRRAFLMRGISNGAIGASGRYLAPAAFVTAVGVWIRRMAGAPAPPTPPVTPYALRTRSSTNIVAISDVQIINVANVNFVINGQRPAIRVPVNTVQAGNTVSVTSVADMVGINGTWKANQVQVDPLNNQFAYISLNPRRRITVVGTYKTSGTARYWNWVLDNITGGTVGNGASRRTGRPPQQLRGRRSSRRS